LRHDEYGERVIDATVNAGETTAEWIPFAEIDDDRLLRSLGLVE